LKYLDVSNENLTDFAELDVLKSFDSLVVNVTNNGLDWESDAGKALLAATKENIFWIGATGKGTESTATTTATTVTSGSTDVTTTEPSDGKTTATSIANADTGDSLPILPIAVLVIAAWSCFSPKKRN
jgi:hypothetical protein